MLSLLNIPKKMLLKMLIVHEKIGTTDSRYFGQKFPFVELQGINKQPYLDSYALMKEILKILMEQVVFA